MKRILAVLTLGLCASVAMAQETAPKVAMDEDDAVLFAQAGPEPQLRKMPGGPGMEAPRARGEFERGPMKFWNNSEIATKINLTDQQKQQLETTFTNFRLKLIDQRAAVEREEVKLEPLVQADKLDEGAITRQIDALISARGQLERTTAMMGVDIRKVLSTEQWKQLKQLHGAGYVHGIGMGVMGGPGGGIRMRQEFRTRHGGRSYGDSEAPPPPPQDDDKGPKGDKGPK
jgi:Spy/CpxP family protein refolding chaperone